MNDAFKNPFCPQGPATRTSFIGRFGILERIETAITPDGALLNQVITGLPKTGKTSLVEQTIIQRKDELIRDNILPIKVSLARLEEGENSFLNFLCVVLNACFVGMEKLDWVTPEIQGLYNSYEEASKHVIQLQALIENFFFRVSEANHRILLIVDEFDAARRLFQGAAPFHFLRELAASAEAGLYLFLTSRRNIAKIERQAGSDFEYLFNDIDEVRLGMFDEKDLDIYFSKFYDVEISYSEDFKERMLWWCGTHPYLLGRFGSEIVQMCCDAKKTSVTKDDVDAVGAEFENSVLINYYQKNLMPLLQDLKICDSLHQILFERTIRVSKTDVDELLHYGLIEETETGTYYAYSGHFRDYLEKQHELSAKSSSVTDATDLTRPVQILFIQGKCVFFEETLLYEFKDISSSKKPVDSIKNTADEYAVAFLNCEGGRIFWGIDDSGFIVGVKVDRKQKDRIREEVSNKLSRITPGMGVNCKLEFHKVYKSDEKTIIDGLSIVELVVPPPLQKTNVFFTESNKLFVKTDGGKKKLEGQQAIAFGLNRSEKA